MGNSYSLEGKQTKSKATEVARKRRLRRAVSQPFYADKGFSFDISYGKSKLMKILRRLIMEKSFVLSLSLPR